MLEKNVIGTNAHNGTVRQGDPQALPYARLPGVPGKLQIRAKVDFEQHRHNAPPSDRRSSTLFWGILMALSSIFG